MRADLTDPILVSNEYAMAIGFSRARDTGQSAFKLGLTYDSSEKVGANAGVGFQF